MLDKKKSPTNETQNIGISKVDSSSKTVVCLQHLYQRGNAGINTLEAKACYQDTCLHTTISQINRVFNIKPERQYETLMNRDGRPTRFMRYWLNEAQREIVAELLGYTKTGARYDNITSSSQ